MTAGLQAKSSSPSACGSATMPANRLPSNKMAKPARRIHDLPRNIGLSLATPAKGVKDSVPRFLFRLTRTAARATLNTCRFDRFKDDHVQLHVDLDEHGKACEFWCRMAGYIDLHSHILY